MMAMVGALAASMEPWHFSHGEQADLSLFGWEERASMEPWHFSHGEGVLLDARAPALQRLQWSHGILAMER